MGGPIGAPVGGALVEKQQHGKQGAIPVLVRVAADDTGAIAKVAHVSPRRLGLLARDGEIHRRYPVAAENLGHSQDNGPAGVHVGHISTLRVLDQGEGVLVPRLRRQHLDHEPLEVVYSGEAIS